ncbi:MAG: 4-(cytidine 5'-diphospho)-2-C-methyl-D-erythritol kinase [Lachnospiraceae bacterium]|nr:4-(cytidine 5'-diphospho)-2-C-methyl-D-erythritol kinase [Lachnospiraceae bacterium]
MRDRIEIKARAKINIGLDVIGRRDDGYHLVKMIMQSLKLYDDIIISKNNGKDILITCDKDNIPCDNRNLAYKAAKELFKEAGIDTGLSIDIKKRIPSSAGLAGGSSDAAAVLKGANELLELGFSTEELMKTGVRIGADVPYCIMGGTALSEGIGERLKRLKDFPECNILLAKPAIDVSTKYVYEKLDDISDYDHPDIDGIVEAINNGNIKRISSLMGNVLELVTEKEYNIIRRIKMIMNENGAQNAMMSGSGPTVFGIYEDEYSIKYSYEKLKKEITDLELIITGPHNAGGMDGGSRTEDGV